MKRKNYLKSFILKIPPNSRIPPNSLALKPHSPADVIDWRKSEPLFSWNNGRIHGCRHRHTFHAQKEERPWQPIFPLFNWKKNLELVVAWESSPSVHQVNTSGVNFNELNPISMEFHSKMASDGNVPGVKIGRRVAHTERPSWNGSCRRRKCYSAPRECNMHLLPERQLWWHNRPSLEGSAPTCWAA